MSFAMVNQKKIKATKTSFAILDYIKKSGGATAREVADNCDISRESAYKHLRTLIDVNAVKNEDGTFVLGPKIPNYQLNTEASNQHYKHHMDKLENLAISLDTSVNFWSKEDHKCVCLYRARPSSEHDNPRELKENLFLTDTIPGRTILAEYSYENREILFESKSFGTKPENINAQIQKAQERGILIESIVTTSGWVSVASAFSTPSGSPVGSIEVVLPSERARGIDLEVNIAGSLLDTINRIEVDTFDS